LKQWQEFKLMNKQIVAGFVSVKSILESNSREVFRILLEKDRFNSVMRSTLRAAEKRQYEILLASGIPVTYLSAEDFSAEVSGSTAGGIAAEVGERKFLSLEEVLAKKNGYFAILDGIEDPFNFGYALRSLYASGVDGVILPERNFFTATETVVRSSAGASELLPCCTVEDLAKACAEIKKRGIKLVSTAKNDRAKDVFHTNFRRPLCVIYGGERRGISAGVM
jgi:23S rRNA (guanosine2251-2'-O)-methyltransferase